MRDTILITKEQLEGWLKQKIISFGEANIHGVHYIEVRPKKAGEDDKNGKERKTARNTGRNSNTTGADE